jgi:quercetin dioxygenase-like cupin family protein
MSPSWQPDDSFLDIENGEIKGVRRVKDALQRHGRHLGEGIVTSKDRDIDQVRKELLHEHTAPGFQQWQLPVALGPNRDVLAFMTVAEPNAVVPEHAHGVELFRMVISGSMFFNNTELKAGDWMVVPKGVSYSLKAASNPGYISYHLYW